MDQSLSLKAASSFLYKCYGIAPLIHFPEEIKNRIFSQLYPIMLYDEAAKILPKDSLSAAAFTEDASCIAVGTDNGPRLWSVEDGSQPEAPVSYESGTITALSFNSKTRSLIAGTDGDHIDTYFMENKGTFAHTKNPISVSYTVPRGKERFRPIYSMAQTPKGHMLFGTEWGNILLLNTETSTVENIFDHPDNCPLISICFSSDGKYMACMHESGKVELVDLTTKAIRTVGDVHSGICKEAFNGLCFSPDNKFLFIPYERALIGFDVEHTQTSVIFDDTEQCLSVQVSPTGKFLLIGDKAKRIRIIDLTTKACVMVLVLTDEISSFAGLFSPDERVLALKTHKFLSLWKHNPLAAYLLSTKVKSEQLLFIKFLRDLSSLDSDKALCKELIDTGELSIQQEGQENERAFFIRHRPDIRKLFDSFDEPVREYIKEHLL